MLVNTKQPSSVIIICCLSCRRKFDTYRACQILTWRTVKCFYYISSALSFFAADARSVGDGHPSCSHCCSVVSRCRYVTYLYKWFVRSLLSFISLSCFFLSCIFSAPMQRDVALSTFRLEPSRGSYYPAMYNRLPVLIKLLTPRCSLVVRYKLCVVFLHYAGGWDCGWQANIQW